MTGSLRLRYVSLAMLTIIVGLLVHLGPLLQASAVRDVVGDILWAAMVVWIVSMIAPLAPLFARAATAYGFCGMIEFSQLYHSAALDATRATTAGHLVLGSGFDPRDFAAYAGGVALAALIDKMLVRRSG